MSEEAYREGGGAAFATESTEPTVNAVFDAITSGPRRTALAYLLREDGTVAFESVVDHVCATTDASRDRAAARLYHVHLPKLADAGLVNYDYVERTVAATDAAHAAEAAMRSFSSR